MQGHHADDGSSLVLHLPTHLREYVQRLAREGNRSEASVAEELLSHAIDEERAWVEAVEGGLRAADEGDVMDFDEFKAQFLADSQSSHRTK